MNIAKIIFNKWTMLIIIIYNIFIYIKDYGLLKGLLRLIITLIIIVLAYFLVYKKVLKSSDSFKWKIVKILQYIGFGSLFIYLLLSKYLPKLIWSILVWCMLFGIVFSILLRLLIKKKDTTNSLEEKIKNDLKITTTTKQINFPKGLRWIGGFVMPALPLFSVLNKKWKKNLNKEAMIHENVHLYYLQNGMILWMLLVVSIFGISLEKIIPILKEFRNVYVAIFFIIFLVYFEYITFNKTNQYGKKLGIVTRIWNKKIMFNYFKVYTIQIMIIFTILYGIKYLINKVS